MILVPAQTALRGVHMTGAGPIRSTGTPALESSGGYVAVWVGRGTLSNMPEEHEPTDDEMEHRLKHLLGEDQVEQSEQEVDPIEAKLAEIEERTKEIRARHPFPDPPDWDFKRPDLTKTGAQGNLSYRDLGFGLTVLYSLVGPLGAGFLVGWFIDRGTPGATVGKLWGTVIGAICGLVATFVIISKHERKG